MNYKDYNDYELISYAISENSEDAMDLIYKKYEPLIIAFSKKMLPFCSGGLEMNDLIQEGRLGLNNAINRFDENKNITFYTFARTCIERKIISAVLATRRLKHKILNESVSIETKHNDSEHTYADYFLKDESNDPEKLLIETEREKSLSGLIKDQLTNFELQVFELKLGQFTYDEISSILDKNNKAVDNALQRIKTKLRNILSKLD